MQHCPYTLATLKTAAAGQMAAYPQYRGHFADYVLCRATRDYTTKAGQVLQRGEFTLCKPAVETMNGKPYRTVWSWVSRMDTLVPAHCVELVPNVAAN